MKIVKESFWMLINITTISLLCYLLELDGYVFVLGCIFSMLAQIIFRIIDVIELLEKSK